MAQVNARERANEPGDYELSLVLTILDDENKVAKVNKRFPVSISAKGTAGYYASTVTGGVSSAVASLQGLIVALCATIMAVLGVVWKVRDARSPKPAAPEIPLAPRRLAARDGIAGLPDIPAGLQAPRRKSRSVKMSAGLRRPRERREL